MYNMLFGANPLSEFFLAMLNLEVKDFARFRDVHISDDPPTIHVFTRLGGGNRECYCSTEDHEGICYQKTIEKLQQHPLYLRDYDDDYDFTYATFDFRAPEQFSETIRELLKLQEQKKPMERFKDLLDKLQNEGLDDPEVKEASDKIRPILEKIFSEIKSSEES